jgi:hypothetical protein
LPNNFRTPINTYDSVIDRDGAPKPISTFQFSVAQTSLDDLSPAADRTILFYEYRDFKPVLDRISGHSIVMFIGSKDYVEKVKSKLGEPQLRVKTRVKSLEPLGKFWALTKLFLVLVYPNFNCFLISYFSKDIFSNLIFSIPKSRTHQRQFHCFYLLFERRGWKMPTGQ